MRDSISRFLRSGIGTMLWTGGVLLALGMHIGLLFANFAGLVQAFEILGMDQKPMADDALLGWLFDAMLIGDATQGHFLAAALVMALAVGFWMDSYFVFNIIDLIGKRARFKIQGHTESAIEAELRIKYDNLPYLLLTLIPLAAVAYWDFSLFRFRALAGSYGIELPENALQMLTPGSLYAKGIDSMVLVLDMLGGWGYISAAFITALVLKFAWIRLKESAAILEGAFLDVLNIGVENQPQGEPATDENPAGASATPEIPVEQAGTAVATAENTVAESNAERPAAEQAAQQPEAEMAAGTSESNADTSHGMTQEPLQSQTAATITTEADELVRVVDENENEPVRMSEIMANTERYYRHEDGRWWSREYYERLHKKEAA